MSQLRLARQTGRSHKPRLDESAQRTVIIAMLVAAKAAMVMPSLPAAAIIGAGRLVEVELGKKGGLHYLRRRRLDSVCCFEGARSSTLFGR